MMSERMRKRASDELEWFYADAEGDACGLRSGGWNVLEETDGSRGGGSGARHFVDPYPDHREAARARLRRLHAALVTLPGGVQAVLEAAFSPRTGREEAVSLLGPRYTRLVVLLREVETSAAGESRHAAAQRLVRRRKEALRRQCDELIADALEAFARAAWPGAFAAEVAR